MGGNAIAKARRVSRQEYEKVIKHIESQGFLVESDQIIDDQNREVQSKTWITGTVVKSYKLKEDFGDIDVVIDDRVDIVPIFAHFRPKKCAVNGQVMSFAYDGIQVDFIRVPAQYLQPTLDYYAYNDLGNLLGKIARRLGLKYGNKGLIYPYRDELENLIEDIEITQDLGAILTCLGLNPSRYHKGFNTLTDIFEYVASSTLFTPSMYYLENASGENRRRDEKRKTYAAFLSWMESLELPEKNPQLLQSSVENMLANLHRDFPQILQRVRDLETQRDADKAFRAKFNGEVVAKITGLDGKELGLFMEWFKRLHGVEKLARYDEFDLRGLIGVGWLDYQKHFPRTKA